MRDERFFLGLRTERTIPTRSDPRTYGIPTPETFIDAGDHPCLHIDGFFPFTERVMDCPDIGFDMTAVHNADLAEAVHRQRQSRRQSSPSTQG